MRPIPRAPLVAAFAGIFSLAILDGWLPGLFERPSPPSNPEEVRAAFSRAQADLAARGKTFQSNPDVLRSIAGGGIAINRIALFAAARQALEKAPPGTWLVLTDPNGRAQAWWGDAPASLAGLVGSEGFGIRWSSTALTVAFRARVGRTTDSGEVCVARTLPALAPDFARALGLSNASPAWEPVAGKGTAPLQVEPSGRVSIGLRLSESVDPAPRSGRTIPLAVTLAAALILIGRARDPGRVGLGLVLAYAALDAFGEASRHSLATAPFWAGALGLALLPRALTLLRRRTSPSPALVAAGFALLLLSFPAATVVAPPDLGAPFAESTLSSLRLSGVAALIAAGLAFSAAGRGRTYRRAWMTAAVLGTTSLIVAALAFVSPRFPFLLFLAAGAAVAFEIWSRAIATSSRAEEFEVPRLIAATALLSLLLVSPAAEHRRAAHNIAVARGISLPDSSKASMNSVFAAERAVEEVSRFDLSRELPAPLAEVDLSDLAYRLWRDAEQDSRNPVLIAFRVFDPADELTSSFSLLPGVATSPAAQSNRLAIDRHVVAFVHRVASLQLSGTPWGRVEVTVADWPSWDPLPPSIEVYRMLVEGGDRGRRKGLPRVRPFLAAYAPDGEKRDEGPTLPARLVERLRRSTQPTPVRLHFRGEELWGEIRPVTEGYRLVAVPGPDLLGRLLTAALLIPGLAVLAGVMALLLSWKIVAAPAGERRDILPRGARTFRGRLVFLFVIGVLIPLLLVTYFQRSAIVTRSQRDTLDHARTALGTARQVLDDYLPSVTEAREGLMAIDDALLAWLAKAVGYDLSVYAPDSTLVATSRRDLYAAGFVPDRVPGSEFVTIGLSGVRQTIGSRLVSEGHIDEITTSLSAIPGVPGVRSPALISLLLLPQQRLAEAEASQLTAAVAAFGLLVFVFSALIAGRLAVRVARPVADLVEGTRAVARGDFSPHVAEPPDEELKELVRAFLSMSRSLKLQTEALSAEKERLATLLAHLTAGVVAYREVGDVLLANPAAAALGGGRADGRTLEDVFPGPAMQEVRRVLLSASESPAADIEPRPGERWRIVTVPLPLGGEGVRMAVIEDVSDVVRSNRLAAWAEMARIIAHE
ncbi:MAG TPA: HAMP domain-containing protein, partial [Thermoanaerobaculia bacterium]